MTLPTAGEHPIIDPIPAGYLEDGERFPRERRAMHLTTAGARKSPSAREHEAGDEWARQQDQEQAEQMVSRHHRDLDAERQADQAHLGEAAGRVASTVASRLRPVSATGPWRRPRRQRS